MHEILRQGRIDRQYYDFNSDESRVESIVNYYVQPSNASNKLIQHIVHDIWRFGEGEDQHLLFEARLLTRSVWDLVAKSVILPRNRVAEVFAPRITALVAGATSFRALVAQRLDQDIILSEREAQSFGNMVIFLRELTTFARLDDLLKTFAPHLADIESPMGQSQVAMSAILVNLGISDLQFAKGIVISAILMALMDQNDIADFTPFQISVVVIRTLQEQLTIESVNDRRVNFNNFTILRKTVRQVQASELRFINAAYGDHMEWGYPQKLTVSKQYQFDVLQDFNKVDFGNQRVSASLVRMIYDRINTQVALYIDTDHNTEGLELSVLVGMILQLPQQEHTVIKNQASDALIVHVGGRLDVAQQILDEQISINEGWSKYVTVSIGLIWHYNDAAANEENLHEAIVKNLEFLMNRYGGDEYAEILITNGIDRALLRKLNVRPMAYIERALRRPELVLRLDNDMTIPNIAVIPPRLEDIRNSVTRLVLKMGEAINDNVRKSEDDQLAIISRMQEDELQQAEDDEEEQDAADYRLQLADQENELAVIAEEEAEQAWQDRLVQDQRESDLERRAEQAWQDRLVQDQHESDLERRAEQVRQDRLVQDQRESDLERRAEAGWQQTLAEGREILRQIDAVRPILTAPQTTEELHPYNTMLTRGDGDDFGSLPKKKPKYFGASRPSDILFEEIFKNQPSTNNNCVINTCEALVQAFPEVHFIVTANFIDLFAQIYEKTPLIGQSLRQRLVICEYENSDIASTLDHILSNDRLEVIVFFRQGHVFPSLVSLIDDKQSSINAMLQGITRKLYQPLVFRSRLDSVRQGLGVKKSTTEDLKRQTNKIRTNVYFDFETTLCEDPHKHQFRGLQQAFLVSITIDIFIPLSKIGIQIFGEEVQGVNDVQLLIPFELIWGLDCDILLLQRFTQIQDFIREGCLVFNDTIDQRQLKFRKIPDIFNAISFNGSKFDNQFVVKGLIKLYSEAWYKHVSIVGDLNDIKVMTYKGIVFLDLRLMCGASSLEQFCKDMQIDLSSSKKKIDYTKMRTFELATQNRQEIESYCAHDTISLRELHIKVQLSLRNLLVNFVEARSTIDNAQIFANTAQIFEGWTTISQLALKIFRNVFCDIEFRATRNHAVVALYRESYKGGYTQSFILGATPSEQPVFYMDFNSMYPFIMASTPFPTDMSKSQLVEREEQVTLHQTTFNQQTRLRLHQQAVGVVPATRLFNLKLENQHFDLFMLTSFEFSRDCRAPSFGVVIPGRGTIYPRTFQSLADDEVSVFGFQLQESFNSGILLQVTFRRSVEFIQGETVAKPIFKTFDDFMFQARAQFKNARNTSMATAVKLLINSLYGKFGQRQHDVEFFASSADIEDGQTFENMLRENTIERRDIQLTPEGVVNGSVRIVPLADINGTPLDVSRIILSGVESLDNDVGSFVLIASLITAVGRQMITNIINTTPGIVYYSDTDSVMMDQQAFDSLRNDSLFTVSDSQFGALKNEYPFENNSNTSAITQIRVLNKKIYQLRVGGQWVSKFKGCTNPTSNLFENFMVEGLHAQVQTRFIKNTASVSIQERNMNYRLRLSRKISQRSIGGYMDSLPFETVGEYLRTYPSSKSYIKYLQGVWTTYQIV